MAARRSAYDTANGIMRDPGRQHRVGVGTREDRLGRGSAIGWLAPAYGAQALEGGRTHRGACFSLHSVVGDNVILIAKGDWWRRRMRSWPLPIRSDANAA